MQSLPNRRIAVITADWARILGNPVLITLNFYKTSAVTNRSINQPAIEKQPTDGHGSSGRKVTL